MILTFFNLNFNKENTNKIKLNKIKFRKKLMLNFNTQIKFLTELPSLNLLFKSHLY